MKLRDMWPLFPRYSAGIFLSAVGGAIVGVCALKGSFRGAMIGIAIGAVGNVLIVISEPFPKVDNE